MVHMEKAEGTVYRDELMAKIIEICTQNNYQVRTSAPTTSEPLVNGTGGELYIDSRAVVVRCDGFLLLCQTPEIVDEFLLNTNL